MRILAAFLLALAALPAAAHPLAPGLLELVEVAPERYAVLWRTSVARAASGAVAPRLPDSCAAQSPRDERIEAGEALAQRWVVQCGGGLAGAALGVDGLDGSGINVILRVVPLAGAAFSALLRAEAPAVTLAPGAVFAPYLAMGAEHLLLGLDHLLFLLGLFLLVPGLRARVATVTAFTVGHSVTLSLAVLGIVPMMSAAAELLIAGSLLWVALALVRDLNAGGATSRPWGAPTTHSHPVGAPHGRDADGTTPWRPASRAAASRPSSTASLPRRTARHPATLAAAFGLVHGLGFAGALREAGLPAGEVPLSLFAFNLGIEAAQLVVIALLLAVAVAARRLVLPRRAPSLAAHAIGAMAVCWMLERSVTLLA